MKTELLCPKCSAALNRELNILTCACDHSWPVDDGVAYLVPDDLVGMVKDTIDSFSFKWKYDPVAASEERVRIANFWYFDKFGFLPGGEDSLRVALAKKKRILDAGCGLGNILSTFARLAPHAEVWGVDLSSAIYEISKLHGTMPNVKLVRGDLSRLPIEGTFDFISSDGVLHHTANTRESFLALSKRLAPGGDLLTYVYRRKAPIREFTDDYLRARTTKMTPEECVEFSRQLADLGRQLREAKVTLKFERPIPLLGIHAGEIDLQRWVYWHVMKCFWDDNGGEVASMLENWDWYHPSIAYRHDPEEVRMWHREAGLEIVRIDVGDSGISSWGRRR